MVTIRDIAQATGVSATTVSNVIHGRNKRVSAETIQSINDAIKELGYVPNMSARSLVSSSSKVIGFVNHVITRTDTNMMDDPFHSAAIGAIETALRENGYYLMLRTVETAEELVAFLQNWNMDGLFFTGIFKDKFFDSVAGLHIHTKSTADKKSTDKFLVMKYPKLLQETFF
jgi:LacI family transcriptional regulator